MKLFKMLPLVVFLPVFALAQDAAVLDTTVVVPDAVVTTVATTVTTVADAGLDVATAIDAVVPTTTVGIIKTISDAIIAKNWALLAAFIVTLLIWAIRKYGTGKIAWLGTKLGGVCLTFVGGIAVMVAAGLLAGASMSWDLLLHGVELAFCAAGGWSIFKSLKEWWQTKKTA